MTRAATVESALLAGYGHPPLVGGWAKIEAMVRAA